MAVTVTEIMAERSHMNKDLLQALAFAVAANGAASADNRLDHRIYGFERIALQGGRVDGAVALDQLAERVANRPKL
jgi:hypothetical protein